MDLLLGSGGFRTDERRATLRAAMQAFFGERERILFVPYALDDHDEYVRAIHRVELDAGYEIDGIHRYDDPRRAVAEAEAIWIGGGNTFRLLSELYRRDLVEGIRERVAAGVPYMGVSAGTNVACPTIMTTNDMPIVYPPTFVALRLFPCQINPHYFAGATHVETETGFERHYGEARDERIREFHEREATPVVGLWEGGILIQHGDRLALEGASARIFQRGQEPIDVEPTPDFAACLGTDHP